MGVLRAFEDAVLARKVATRFILAGWLNGANGDFFSLRWSRTTWHIEESETPIDSTNLIGEVSGLVTYEMPTLSNAFKKIDYTLEIGVDLVRQYAHIKVNDKGPVVREKLIHGYKEYFKGVEESLKESVALGNIDSSKLEAFQKATPAVLKKLVWKKIK